VTAARVSLLPLLALVAVYSASFAILHSSWFADDATLFSAAISIDLTITATLLVWWLGVHRAGWPRWTIGATIGAGLLTARTALPDTDVVTVLIGIWVIAELALVTLAIARLRTVIRIARGHHGAGPIAALVAGLSAARVPARIAELIATDAIVLWLGITGWFRRSRAGLTMHRTNGWALIIGVFLALIVVEAALVHLVVVEWSVLVAWILTGSSIYAALWFGADLHVLRLYPLRVDREHVHLALGIRWRAEIPRAAITSIEDVREAPKGAFDAGLGGANLVLHLDREVELRGLFGIRRRATAIALTLDDAAALRAALAA
jgi:hypothetical protein